MKMINFQEEGVPLLSLINRIPRIIITLMESDPLIRYLNSTILNL